MSDSMPRLAPIVVAIAISAIAAGPASASVSASARMRQEKQIGDCIAAAAQGREWLAKTLWALRDQEGGWIGAEVENRDGSHDLGPLQVNSWWVGVLAAQTQRPASDVRRWLIGDACFNVQAARWIFLSELRRHRHFWTAVGAYHSPTAWRRASYARSVARRLKLRFGSQAFESD